MGLCLDISTLLTAESNIFIGDMPDSPNSLACIYQTSGFNQEINLNKESIERPTLMIKVRDTSYVNGLSRCEVIKTAINKITNTTINTTFYIEIFVTGDINILGKDEKNRWQFSMNFRTRLTK